MINSFVELYDLDTSARYKFEKHIEQTGGRYSFQEKWKKGGIGLSGLVFEQKTNAITILAHDDNRHKIILELIRNGLIIYMRNRMVNYGFVIHDSQISHYSLEKKNDILTLSDRSLIKKLLDAGFDYFKVRNFVLENDKVEFHPIYSSIHLKDGQKLVFEVERFIPDKIFEFFKSKTNHKVEILVDHYTLIPA